MSSRCSRSNPSIVCCRMNAASAPKQSRTGWRDTPERRLSSVATPVSSECGPSADSSVRSPAWICPGSDSHRSSSSDTARSPELKPNCLVASSSRWCASSTTSRVYGGRTRPPDAVSESSSEWLTTTMCDASAFRRAFCRKQLPSTTYGLLLLVQSAPSALNLRQTASSPCDRRNSARSPVSVCESQITIRAASIASSSLITPTDRNASNRLRHR